MPAAPASAAQLAQLLARSRLLAADDVRAALKKWAGPDDDVDGFRKFLVHAKLLTDYQAALLSRGYADGFFFDDYKILELIGKGRMAGVYKAVHNLGQVVAIKVLPSSRAKDATVLARFRRESRLLTSLDHPNVVRAFQVGDAAGKPYLVMEHLDGETLEEVLARRKKLPPAEAARVVSQALLGLQHIHERGMIHRDLKPANLMLVPPAGAKGVEVDPKTATVKIVDIGLGKTFDEDARPADDPTLTGTGMLLGTPDYLAPEQARNASGADVRADIYSLGCVLYHCVAGQSPFPDTTVLNQVIRHATEKPRPLLDFVGSVPEGLQKVVDTMLAKEPADRFQTPEKAARALQPFLPASAGSGPAVPLPAYLQWLRSDGDIDVPQATAAPAAATTPVPAKRAKPVAPPKGRPADDEYDVEVVPDAPPPPRPAERRRLFDLDRRDVIMLAVGGLIVAGAVGAGYVLSRRSSATTRRRTNPKKTKIR